MPILLCSVQPTELWSRCNVTSPQTCDTSINDADDPSSTDSPANPTNPANTGGTSSTATRRPVTSNGNIVNDNTDDGKFFSWYGSKSRNVLNCMCVDLRTV